MAVLISSFQLQNGGQMNRRFVHAHACDVAALPAERAVFFSAA